MVRIVAPAFPIRSASGEGLNESMLKGAGGYDLIRRVCTRQSYCAPSLACPVEVLDSGALRSVWCRPYVDGDGALRWGFLAVAAGITL